MSKVIGLVHDLQTSMDDGYIVLDRETEKITIYARIDLNILILLTMNNRLIIEFQQRTISEIYMSQHPGVSL